MAFHTGNSQVLFVAEGQLYEGLTNRHRSEISPWVLRLSSHLFTGDLMLNNICQRLVVVFRPRGHPFGKLTLVLTGGLK